MPTRARRVLVFFPTRSEVGAAERLVRDVTERLPEAALLVVDDASPDGTGELLDRLASERHGMTVIHRPSALGVGSAHKLALLFARAHGYDVLLTLAGDGSHPTDALPRVLAALDGADFVVAGAPRDASLLRRRITRAATTLAVGRDTSAYASLLRGYARNVIEGLDVNAIGSDGHAFAVESLAHVATVTTRWAALGLPGSPERSVRTRLARGTVEAVLRILAARGSRRPEKSEVGGAPLECRICSGIFHVEVHEARDDEKTTRRDVSPYSCASHSGRTHGPILRCLTCGMTFMRPKLTSDALVSEYRNVVDPVYLDNMPARFATFRHTLTKIAPILGSPARVLEVGSYCGAFLKVARERGIDIVGLEPSAWAAAQASRVTDAKIFQGTLDDVPRELGPFDAVVAWDVVEHFADPVAELRKVNRLLPMGGRFFFCTLMIDNWFPRLAGSHWPWFMDMHLFYFDEGTIRDVLRRSGFVLVESTPYRHITTIEYLLRKLGTLGVPGARIASKIASSTPWGRNQIPVRLGDIQLFSCTKVAEVPAVEAARAAQTASGREPSPRRSTLLN